MQEERIPRLVEGADVMAHNIGAKEGFVYSCIDGVLNVEDIADVTVLPTEEVSRVIEHLISLHLVEWVDSKVHSVPAEADVEPDVDIPEDIQKQVLEAFRRVGKLNHYERLGVAIDAKPKEIRKAYFALSKTFHPDAYYGKQLGSFQSKMEVVFRNITDSYEAIGRPKKREAYDRYLQQQVAVLEAERQIDRVEERAQAMARALTKVPVAQRHSAPAPSSSGWMPSGAPEPISIRDAASPASNVVPGSPEHARMERKRELLERRLRGKAKQQPKVPARSTPVPTARVGKKAALRDLTRSLKDTAVLTGGVDRAQHHIENARIAELEGDLARAATALRMAIALDSSSRELREQYRRVNSNLRIQLVDIHRQQAKYEEENNLWAAASISWAKVAEAAPDDHEAPRHAAKALLAAGGDLRKARDFAQHSLELKPDSLDTRLLLARIYMDAGMDQSAEKELKEAAKLDPGHEMVKNLKKQLGG
ncbi:MAG: DnaJ domain-containing protein [Myxococcales bacterium]|nr:DnaJ domain-containing protein [Myxococcales bacterium]MDH3486003.1 DnaJ domain-containing protein [Myxococcales bacterium]